MIYSQWIFFYALFSWVSDNADDSEDKSTLDNNKKRRKNKVHEIKEESHITSDFAAQLDLSCMSKGLVKAPSIGNGYIAKYNRWMSRSKRSADDFLCFVEENCEMEKSHDFFWEKL